jgi:hypothetical protein
MADDRNTIPGDDDVKGRVDEAEERDDEFEDDEEDTDEVDDAADVNEE